MSQLKVKIMPIAKVLRFLEAEYEGIDDPKTTGYPNRRHISVSIHKDMDRPHIR